MLKHPGEQEPISKIMRSGDVCDPHDVVDQEGRQVDLLSSIRQISEALVHSICLISPLRPRDDVLDYKREDQLMERLHITLFHSLRVFQPWLLAQMLGQLQQPCLPSKDLSSRTYRSNSVGGTPKITPSGLA